MLKIGITGGIGSGKTTVARIFGLLGIPVYNSDIRAREIMTTDLAVIAELKNTFGNKVYLEQGNLNRKLLADLVFNDEERLAELNGIVHPAVGRDFARWCEINSNQDYVLKEAALIFETSLQTSLDRVILVWAPEELRIERVTVRDDIKPEDVRARMRNQWNDKDKVALSDFLVVNDGEHSLIRQVMEIHHLLTDESRSSS